MTTAQKIATLLNDDGLNFEAEDGSTLAALCEAEDSLIERDGEDWRYQFADGSALTGNASGWDEEGSRPYRMAGLE